MQNKINTGIIISFLIALGIVYNIMNDTSFISSTLISISFVYVFFMFIRQLAYKKINQEYLRLLCFSFVFVFFNVTLSGVGGFDYYKKAIMYSATITWMICCVNYRLSKKTVSVILFINLFINLLYLLFYQQGFSVYEGQVLLTLNFANPNQTGMFILNSLLYTGIMITAGNDLVEKKIHYFIMLAILIPIFLKVAQLLVLTGCRSSYMSLALFAFLVIVDYLFRGKIKIKKWMALSISIVPFVFVFIYLAYASNLSADVAMGVEDAGKSSTTRIPIWKPIIDNFWHYFIIGDYYGISNGTGMSQMHNTHLDVYASYGILPLILYVRIIYLVICQSVRNSCSRFQRISVYAFIACMVSCMFEASLVAGSAGMFFLTIGFLAFANSPMQKAYSPVS